MSSLFHKTIKGFSWTALEQMSGQLIQLGLFILLARILDKEVFGLIALANIVVTFLQIFTSQGFSDAIIQRKDAQEHTLDTAFWMNLAVGICMAALSAFALAPLTAKFFNEPVLVPVLQVLSLGFILGSLNTVPVAQLRRQMHFRPLAVRTMIGRLGGGIAGISVAIAGGGVWSLVAMQLSTQLISTIALWAQSDYRPRLRYNHTDCKEMLNFSSHLIGYHVINFLNFRYDIFILGKFFSIDVVGVYSVAQKIIELSVSLFMGVFGAVGYPLMCRLRHDMDNFRQQVRRLFDLIMYASVPFTVALTCFAEPIVHLFFGEKWLSVVPMMVVMAPMLLVRIPTYAEMLGITALGRPGLRFGLGIFASTVSVALFSLVIDRGIEAFVFVASLRYFILAVPVGIFFCRCSGITLRQLATVHLAPLLLAVATIGCASALANTLGLTSQLQQFLVLAGGSVAFILITLLVKRDEIQQIKSLLQRKKHSAASESL